MSLPLRLLLPAALAGLLALPAYAIERETLTLRVSALRVDASSALRGRTQFQGADYDFDETFDFGSDEIVPRVDGELRLGERHRLVFNYFDYDKDQGGTLGEPISFDSVTIPAGSVALGGTRFRVAGLAYDFAVVETPSLSLGLQLGVQHARLEGRLFAQDGANTYDERGDAEGWLPVLGVRASIVPAEPWRIVLQAQHFNASWGDFGDTDGRYTRASALVEYRFNDRFGVHAGYDWLRLQASDESNDGLTGLDQRFRGPMIGLTVAF